MAALLPGCRLFYGREDAGGNARLLLLRRDGGSIHLLAIDLALLRLAGGIVFALLLGLALLLRFRGFVAHGFGRFGCFGSSGWTRKSFAPRIEGGEEFGEIDG